MSKKYKRSAGFIAIEETPERTNHVTKAVLGGVAHYEAPQQPNNTNLSNTALGTVIN
ncbi:MAG: hypothetical protein AB8B86_15930 [Pseudomonadales bacterium]